MMGPTIVRLATTALLLSGTLVASVRAEDARIQAYEEQMNRMQRELDELRARLRALEEERGTPAAPSAAPVAAAPSPAPPVVAAPVAGEQDRKIGVLAQEVERIKSQLVLPQAKEYKALYGFGPAASKVYQIERGLSIGGYGEFNYQNLVSDQGGRKDQFDYLRFVLYTGYKFSERIVLNAEIEFEHALTESTVSADGGAVEVEFAALDFFLWEPLNLRTGLLLVPMGFLNEVHEPPFYYGNLRPEVERQIIPTTWREGGVGFFGTLAPGLEYRAYVLNSLNAEGFSSSNIRDARQSGNRAFANDISGTARVEYSPIAGASIGGSFWAGDSGQDQDFAGEKPGAFTLLWETHAQLHYRGLDLRLLGAFVSIDDAAVLSRALEDTIAEDMFGFYAEAGYDVLPWLVADTRQSLAPFFRYEIFDTQDKVPSGFRRVPGKNVQLYTVGLSYKPLPQVVVKLDYRNFDAGNVAPRADEVNIGAGFIF